MIATGTCQHVADIADVVPQSADSCRACIAAGDTWVHLRVCLVCGHVGCCDDSRNQHARRHYESTGHAVIQSYEPRERWRYCFADEVMLPPARPFR